MYTYFFLDTASDIVKCVKNNEDRQEVFSKFVDVFELDDYEVIEFAKMCDFEITESVQKV